MAPFRRVAARRPYEIAKPYGSPVVADQYLNKSTFAAKFARFLGKTAVGQPQGRRTTISHVDVRAGPVNCMLNNSAMRRAVRQLYDLFLIGTLFHMNTQVAVDVVVLPSLRKLVKNWQNRL